MNIQNVNTILSLDIFICAMVIVCICANISLGMKKTCPIGDLQEKGPDFVVDCVYGLAVNVANIIVILWTMLILYVISDCQIWYCPCYDHDISHICG